VPAVQRTRDAANRTQCLNNLRQIGLACHLYHGHYQTLPPALSSGGPADQTPYMSWLTRLLPYLDQPALWQDAQRAYAQDASFLAPPHDLVRSQVVRVFLCPSDGRVQASAPAGLGGVEVAFTSYLGVEGTDVTRKDGVLFVDSRVALQTIADGTSN